MKSPRPRELIWLDLSLLLCLGLAACGSPSSRNLYYIWNGSHCPLVAPPALNLDQDAGFTSRSPAARVAATETVGIGEFWQARVKSLHNAVVSQSSRRTRAALAAQLAATRAQAKAFSHCRRIVVRGKANPVPAATLPPLPAGP